MVANRSSSLKSLVGRVLRLTGHLPPPLRRAIHWRLFCTPFVHRRDPVEQRFLEEGQPFWIPSGVYRLPGWVFPNEGPTVLLCHGWQGSAASWSGLVPMLREAGFQVVVFHAPGHHQRPVRSSLPDFTRGLLDMAATFRPRYLVGHSFGAMTVARTLAQGLEVEGAVLYSPPNSLQELASGFCRNLRMSQEAEREFFQCLHANVPAGLEGETVCRYLQECDIPLLLFHDPEDEVVPYSCSEAIRDAHQVPLVTTEGLGHRLIIRNPDTARQSTDFLLNLEKNS